MGVVFDDGSIDLKMHNLKKENSFTPQLRVDQKLIDCSAAEPPILNSKQNPYFSVIKMESFPYNKSKK